MFGYYSTIGYHPPLGSSKRSYRPPPKKTEKVVTKVVTKTTKVVPGERPVISQVIRQSPRAVKTFVPPDPPKAPTLPRTPGPPGIRPPSAADMAMLAAPTWYKSPVVIAAGVGVVAVTAFIAIKVRRK